MKLQRYWSLPIMSQQHRGQASCATIIFCPTPTASDRDLCLNASPSSTMRNLSATASSTFYTSTLLFIKRHGDYLTSYNDKASTLPTQRP